MTLWIIEPRDPLIVRDGRPFGPNPGARATTLPFPFPSTIAGALRHKAGLDANGQFDPSQASKVLKLGVQGPLLVELDNDHVINDWLLPAPADALLVDLEPHQPNMALRRWLVPRVLERDVVTSLQDDLLPIAPSTPTPNKVSSNAPRFWGKNVFAHWLSKPQDDSTDLRALGLGSLESNIRMHVSIQTRTQTAREGALFQTNGLEFTWRDRLQEQRGSFVTKRLALAAWFDGNSQQFQGGLAPMGGERRLMRWRTDSSSAAPFDNALCNTIFEQIQAQRHCRVVLLTPAFFSAGYRPPLQWVRGGVAAKLVGAAVPRPQTVSGWDMAHRNKNGSYGRPKPTRRLAPVGSVYYVRFPEDADIIAWLKATWMCNVSDDAQDDKQQVDPNQHRLDGFGLAVVGTWPGVMQEEQR